MSAVNTLIGGYAGIGGGGWGTAEDYDGPVVAIQGSTGARASTGGRVEYSLSLLLLLALAFLVVLHVGGFKSLLAISK